MICVHVNGVCLERRARRTHCTSVPHRMKRANLSSQVHVSQVGSPPLCDSSSSQEFASCRSGRQLLAMPAHLQICRCVSTYTAFHSSGVPAKPCQTKRQNVLGLFAFPDFRLSPCSSDFTSCNCNCFELTEQKKSFKPSKQNKTELHKVQNKTELPKKRKQSCVKIKVKSSG